MTSTSIFEVVCPDCGTTLEPATEPEGIWRGLYACTTCGVTYLVDMGYAIAVDSPVDQSGDATTLVRPNG